MISFIRRSPESVPLGPSPRTENRNTRTMASGQDTAPSELQMLLDGPALDPPPGVVPNLDTDGNHTLGYAVVIVTAVLSTLAVLVRLTASLPMKRLGLEEFLVVCSLVHTEILEMVEKANSRFRGSSLARHMSCMTFRYFPAWGFTNGTSS